MLSPSLNRLTHSHVWGGIAVALFLSTQSAQAQDPAPGLQDLVGARGSSGERALEQRGYK